MNPSEAERDLFLSSLGVRFLTRSRCPIRGRN